MLKNLFKAKTSTDSLRNELSKAVIVSNKLFKITELKQQRINCLEREIKLIKQQLESEREYNELLKSGYESQREKNFQLNGKINDIRSTDAYQAKYN